jgi:hypothetical protein
MKTRLRFSIALAIAAAALAIASGRSPSAPAMPAVRLECAAARILRLHRFEDGSAQLFCGSRLLVRISSPG